jgi:hypothetical protein
MPEPTPQDIANAELRASIARRQQAEYALALGLATSVFGPGWEPCGRHMLIAHDEAERCRHSGDRPVPAATVYSAERDGVKRHFMVIDGQAREVESVEAGFGAMLTEPDATRTIEVRGQQVHPHRHGLYWAGYEPGYAPRTAEQLAADRERRQHRAVEKAIAEIEMDASASLFPDWVREVGIEQLDAKRKGRRR